MGLQWLDGAAPFLVGPGCERWWSLLLAPARRLVIASNTVLRLPLLACKLYVCACAIPVVDLSLGASTFPLPSPLPRLGEWGAGGCGALDGW